MVRISLLFISVFTLFCFMLPGFILRKTKLVEQGFAKGLSVFTIYFAQAALLLYGFLQEFDPAVFKRVCLALLMGIQTHILFYIMAKQFFRKAPDRMRRVLQFGLVFSNAGYMGIPVISDVFGPEYTIYATFYVVCFNVFAFSLGRLIYTDDKKYISMKEAILNPAVIPIIIGFIIYLTGIGGWIQRTALQPDFLGQAVKIFYNIVVALKDMVAVTSMMVIGLRLADINFKGILKDKYMYPFIGLRLFLFPTVIWAILRLLNGVGFIDETVLSIILILCSTPAAALTTMFAELYDGDAPYAGKLVALTTILSVATMPIVALLLQI